MFTNNNSRVYVGLKRIFALIQSCLKLEHTYIRLMVVLVLVFVSQVQLHAQHQLHLKFINVVDDSMMAPGATYQNVFGETFTINNFK